MPDPGSAVGRLAGALRRSRAARRLTQAQAAAVLSTSESTVQRAEAGVSTPKKYVVEGYVAKLGLDPEEAEHLLTEATRPPGRQRRVLTQAPHPGLVSTREELGRALARVWEEDNCPSPRGMQDRADKAAARTAGQQQVSTQYAFLSKSAAYRIAHRRQLPSRVEQLRSYLHACRVKENGYEVWVAAYHRVKVKEKEEAKARTEARAEERRRWRGEAGRRRAIEIMLKARLIPAESFSGSATAPWTARCRDCGLVGRFRLASVRQGHGCRECASPPQSAGRDGDSAVPAGTPPEADQALARARVPAVPGSGAEALWAGHCATCGSAGGSEYGNSRSVDSAQGSCRMCGRSRETGTEADSGVRSVV
ncbi:helix-turn-helix domain-containing protein [Streptomyces xinghaiensis]|uniref:helix-turn-helix domain-containing protein n=1 Tax=Streptomyces xinghaiensis TaxID=1038928 RepID=UPI000684736D|nr:helix-turn-helix domain-containing protein [Streptomyces xinghaiensis]MZE76808.1 helix-turn-helix domain-containing protein [Streptomyces sp. SID5475]